LPTVVVNPDDKLTGHEMTWAEVDPALVLTAPPLVIVSVPLDPCWIVITSAPASPRVMLVTPRFPFNAMVVPPALFTVMLSLAPGTPAGDQFDALPQSESTEPVQV